MSDHMADAALMIRILSLPFKALRWLALMMLYGMALGGLSMLIFAAVVFLTWEWWQ